MSSLDRPVKSLRPAARLAGLGSMLLVALLVLVGGSGLAHAERRLALVIGNGGYKLGALDNPPHDAELMAKTLAGVGFDVTKLIDADQKTMKKAMLEFGRVLRDTDSVGLFYYAGHGLQVGGKNYLIPVGANIRDEADVPVESVAVDEFLLTMERAASRINIAILDACRNNPFNTGKRSLKSGLARVEAPTGTIIAYATAPGEEAFDGKAGNSPYTTALAKAIATPGISVEEVFKRTRRSVLAVTGQKQTPWESSSLTGDFYFKPPPLAAESADQEETPVAGAAAPDQRLVELEAFEKIKGSDDPAVWRAFLARFPGGNFAEAARLRLTKLEPASAVAAAGGSGATQPPAGDQSGASNSATGAPAASPESSGIPPVASGDSDAPDSAEGLFKLALKLETGAGGEKDPTRAAELYRKAISKGHSGAIASLGGLYERGEGIGKDPREAMRLYRKAADKGDPSGLTALARLYELGLGVPKDELEAARHYRRAASLGFGPALTALGLMHREARGVPKDLNEAFELFRRAAELGDAPAMYYLGWCYEKGKGTSRNLAEAAAWYRQGAIKGFGPAKGALGALLEFGEGETKNIAEAIEWYKQAAEAGDVKATTNLAYLYEQGKGTAPNLGEAVRLYKQAVSAGDPRAMFNLGSLYAAGRGVPQDDAEAVKLYRQSAEKGYAAALRALALAYDEGKGVKRDPAQAARFLLKAFLKGHKETRDELYQTPETWTDATRREIQKQLRLAGFFKGSPDGRFGASTTAALRAYARTE